MQPRALRKLILDVWHDSLEHVLHRRMWRRLAEYFGIDGEQLPWLLIGRTPQHHAVDIAKMPFGLVKAFDPAIDDDGHVRQRGLQPIHPVVIERRDVAIFLRR